MSFLMYKLLDSVKNSRPPRKTLKVRSKTKWRGSLIWRDLFGEMYERTIPCQYFYLTSLVMCLFLQSYQIFFYENTLSVVNDLCWKVSGHKDTRLSDFLLLITPSLQLHLCVRCLGSLSLTIYHQDMRNAEQVWQNVMSFVNQLNELSNIYIGPHINETQHIQMESTLTAEYQDWMKMFQIKVESRREHTFSTY